MLTAFLNQSILPARWRQWEPNPILVKELRQAVRSNVLSGVMLLLLVMLFIGSVATLAGQSVVEARALETGRDMFDVCLSVLTAACVVVIPLYTGIRVALEQHESDLTLYTPLPVVKLVRGKVLSGVCLAGLFYSVCMPFMMFCNLLRGVDWLTIQFVLLVLFGAICVAVLGAIAVGSMPLPVVIKIVMGAAFAGGLVVFCGLLLLFLFGVVRSGAAPLLRSSSFFFGFLPVCGTALIGSMTAYSVAISHIIKERRPYDPYGYKPTFAQAHG